MHIGVYATGWFGKKPGKKGMYKKEKERKESRKNPGNRRRRRAKRSKTREELFMVEGPNGVYTEEAAPDNR